MDLTVNAMKNPGRVKQGTEMILLGFLKDHSGYFTVNGLGKNKSGSRDTVNRSL